MKIKINRKQFLIGFSVIFSAQLVLGQELLIKKNSDDHGKPCQYETLSVLKSGKMELLLSNFTACLDTLNNSSTSDDDEQNQNSICTFKEKEYNIGESILVYKTESDCSNPVTARCKAESDFIPSGYTAIKCEQENSLNISDGWLKDTLNVGDNITSLDLYGGSGSPEGYVVKTMDGNILVTAPSCANNRRKSSCSTSADWLPGARTNEVYSIRKRRNSSNIRLDFDPILIGVNVQPSRYDVTISPNPGQMNGSGDFKGRGCIKTNNKQFNFSIVLLNDAKYERYKNELTAESCYIPEDALYYVNIRATNPLCDKTGQPRTDENGKLLGGVYGPCNSFYEVH